MITTFLPKPPTIDDKALAAVDGQWRTAPEIFAIIDQEAPTTTRTALIRLANSGKVERRYDAHPNGKIAKYRRRIEALQVA